MALDIKQINVTTKIYLERKITRPSVDPLMHRSMDIRSKYVTKDIKPCSMIWDQHDMYKSTKPFEGIPVILVGKESYCCLQ